MRAWPPSSTAVYISVGCTAIARLAGKVHGVVVQITSETGRPPTARTSSAGTVLTGNFT